MRVLEMNWLWSSEKRDLPAALQTIDGLHHGVLSRHFGISCELPSNFADRGPRDSSDALLYRLSYLGGTLILLGIPQTNRMV